MKNTQQGLSIFFLFVALFVSQDLFGRLRISRDNFIADQGETVCMEFVVEDFDDLLGITFAVKWDPAIVQFARTENLDPLFTSNPFSTAKVDEGELFFFWADEATIPRSLPDGQIIFSVCFEAIGAEGEEAKVSIGNAQDGRELEVLNKDFENIRISAPDALINIEFSEVPENAIELYFDDVNISEGESFCVPIRVRNFNEAALLSFTLVFNNNRFLFNSLDNLENWAGQATVLTLTSNANSRGEIVYSMIDNTSTGQSLADGDALFELCFTHELNETCVLDEIMISSSPTTIEAEIALPDLVTEEVPVFYESGKIKLQTPITYNGSEITPVSCNDPNIGAITVDASVGTDGIKYLWSTGETTNSISNLAAGTYDVSISDICLAVDTIFRSFEVIIDGNMPTADAGEDVEFNCGVESVTLDGSRSSTGASVVYSWRGIDGQSIISGASANQAEVDAIGRYELVAMDVTSGCSTMDTVEVIDLRILPDVMAGDDVMLQCDDVTIELRGTGTPGVNFRYEWTLNDNIISQTSKGVIEIDQPGTYVFKITDAASGCFATDELIVSGSNVIPTLGITGMTTLTCDNAELTLSANNAIETGITYQWSTLDGTIVSGADAFEAVVSADGRYEVRAESAGGCSSIDAVVIIDGRSMPIAVAGDDAMIGCDDDDITLEGFGSRGARYEYNWTTTDGSIVSQMPDGQAIINSAGTYTFTVREIDNGCTTSDDVIVTGDNQRPQASISGSTTLDCNTTTLQLNANNGGGGAAGLSYFWSTTDGSISDGADGVLATIDQPGTYMVRVTNDASGCSDNSTVTVISEAVNPMITSSADVTADCSTEIKTLAATSNNMTNVNFMWNVIEGDGQIITGATSAAIEVMGEGKYEVIVTNPLNGCSSRDTTTVSLSGALLEAQVGMDYDHCESETILMGNQEGDATGLWTVIAGSSALEDPNDRNCRVNSLSSGSNTFVWTLSSDGCPDYSSDTININFVAAPIAVDDNFEVSQGFGSLDIDLLLNDQYSSETGATINLSSQPSLGLLIENGNGQFTYTLDNPNAFGTYTFEYEICDDLCSLNCDTGTVTINVRDGSITPNPDSSTNDPQSIGITPNGDGLNDQLVFDELITEADKYSTKRLIVFNRWGDIVHEAQPYNNDWGGTNKSGNLLPQGTYYFVMQLDLGQGAVIEGDVTILQ